MKIKFIAVVTLAGFFAGCTTITPKEPAYETLIAHRGESVDAPENTLPAYQMAVDRGFGFECDIYLSADGQLFTFHDSNLKRTTGGAHQERCIEANWAETVSKINVGGWGRWKGTRFDPTRPARLEEVLALARPGRKIYVEVKGDSAAIAWVPTIKKVFDSIEAATPDTVLFICFDAPTCAELKRQMPCYKVFWLTDDMKGPQHAQRPITPEELIATMTKYGVDGVDILFNPTLHTADFVRKVKSAGFEFHVWTVDDFETAKKAFAAGVDSLTTNCAKKLRDAYEAEKKAAEKRDNTRTGGVYDVTDFGARGDGATKDTAAIQAAIDAASAAGGGEVRVPAGRYITGTLYLKSNVDFNITIGATIEASKDPADYNKWNFCPQNDRSLAENHEGGHLFVCLEQTNVVLRGHGTIDGNGRHFMTHGFDNSRIGKRSGINGLGSTNPQDAILWRPAQMLWFCESDQVRLEGLRIRNAPYWSILLIGCTYVHVHGLDIRTSRKNPRIMNGDGLNIDCCQHVAVSDCEIETSDDSLCLRATGKRLRHASRETAFVTVNNCVLSSREEAFRIGVGDGPIHDCTINNCVIRDSRRGINFSSTWFPSKGCDFENIRFNNIVSHTSSSFLRIHRLKSTDPVVRELHFSNICGTQGDPSYIWSRRGKPFENITLSNVNMNNGIEVVNVNGFQLNGGSLEQIKLHPAEYEQRSQDIETFRKMLY